LWDEECLLTKVILSPYIVHSSPNVSVSFRLRAHKFPFVRRSVFRCGAAKSKALALPASADACFLTSAQTGACAEGGIVGWGKALK
jgi:hypothetical protein